jgi:hypothetical protein
MQATTQQYLAPCILLICYESAVSHRVLVKAGGLPLGQTTNDFQTDEFDKKTPNVSYAVNF